MQLAAALPVITESHRHPALQLNTPRSFDCPQHQAQAVELPANVTPGNTPCTNTLVALGLAPWSRRLMGMGMPWRAQAINLLQLPHEPNWNVTHGSSRCCSRGESIPRGPGSSIRRRQGSQVPLFQLCACSRRYRSPQHTQLHLCPHPGSYGTS